ncbi:MAG TPA: choice-of-anchor P family protein [Gemmatimonadales bacterium]|nr:choice-of-anchor P family protein [Gemmatimonadales bacterium]
MNMPWVNCLAAFGLVFVVTGGFAAVGNAQSISGQAYGAYVNTPVASFAQSPLAVLPFTSGTDGNIATAEADVLNVPNALSSDFLNSTATGALGATEASAQSVATVADINILNGLIAATEVIATVTSTRTASGASSSGNGSSFEGLTVAGVPVTSGDGWVAPNTQMSLPGVGYVVLNEQIPSGDGVTSSGLTVNMIHVYLQSLTGGGCTVLGCLPGTLTNTGEIIVGSATSSVGP